MRRLNFDIFRVTKSFGMLTDKFGAHWMVNGEMLPV
jgi:uncharacterized glyoxalase superfamily protein PhnB